MKRIKENINIDMTILDNSTFLSPYCGNVKIISSEVASYLDNILNYYPPKLNLTLRINSKSTNQEDEKIFKEAIINYYQNNIYRLKRDLLRNMIIALIMLIIGSIFITLMLIIGNKNSNPIWTTILEIAGWVFIWEAVDKFFFERHSLNKELRKSIQIVSAKIEFTKSE